MHRFILAVLALVAATVSFPALTFEVCDEPQRDRFQYSRQLEQDNPLDLPAGLGDHQARLSAEDRAFAALLFRTALTQIIRRQYAHVFLGHFSTRMDTLQQDVEFAPDTEYGYLLALRGTVLFTNPGGMEAKHRFDAAWGSLDQSVDYNPFDATSWLRLARMAIMKEQCDDALTFADYARQVMQPEENGALTQMFLKMSQTLARDPAKCEEVGRTYREQSGFGDLH